MKHFNFFLAVILLTLFFYSNNSFSQWVQINTPGRVVRSFSISENRIFAGTYEALYYSSDNGNSWIYSFYDMNSAIYPLAINDTIIFVGSSSTGVYLSTNSCQSWVQLNIYNLMVYVLIKNNSYIYAGTFGGIYRSSNLGADWIYVSNGIQPWKWARQMTESDTTMYAVVASSGNSGNKVYRSTNNGELWTSIFEASFNGMNVVSAIAAAGSHVNMAVNNYANSYKNYILYSSNYGDDWIIPSMGPPTDCSISYFAIKDSNIFSGTSRGVFLSQDHGDVWIPVNEGLIDTSVSALVIFGYHIFAATDNSTIWKRPLSDFGIISVNEIAGEVPQEYYLSQNYPNPFNPRTTISFSIPQSQNVELKVFDVLGNEVTTLINEYKQAGEHKVEFDGSTLTTGIYFYQIKTGEFIQTKKLILIK